MIEYEILTLKPCPFCGGKAAFVERGDIYKFKVECQKCGVIVGGTAFKNDAYNANKWNVRVHF